MENMGRHQCLIVIFCSSHFGPVPDVRIRFDKHTLGNLVKNLAPVAGTLVGGPAGLALAGGLGALGEAGRGKTHFSDLLKSGLSNAAIAGAGEGVAGHFGFHGVGGLGGIGSPAAATPSVNVGQLPGASMMSSGGVPGLAAAPSGLGADTIAATPGNFAGNVLSKGGKLLDFAEAHPNAASGVFQGLGAIQGSGSENRLRNAQADNLEAQSGTTQYELDQLKRRQAQYAPIFSSLAQGPTSGGYANVAKNPYQP